MASASAYLIACANAAGVEASEAWTPKQILRATASRLRTILNRIGRERSIADGRITGLVSLAWQAAFEARISPTEPVSSGSVLRQAQVLAQALDIHIPEEEFLRAEASAKQGRDRRPGSGGRIRLAPKAAAAGCDILLKYIERDVGLGARVAQEEELLSRIEAEQKKKLNYGRNAAIMMRERKMDASTASGDALPQYLHPPPQPLPFLTRPEGALASNVQPASARMRPQASGIPAADAVAPLARSYAGVGIMNGGAGRGPKLPFGPASGTGQARRPVQAVGKSVPPAPVAAPPRSYYEQQAENSRRILLEQELQEKALAEASAAAANPAEVAAERAAYAALLADDAFMAPLHHHFGPVEGKPDRNSSQTLRAVLAERERVLYRCNQARQSELAAEPHDLPDEVRRKAIIEGKSLRLIELQRVVRFRVVTEDRKLLADPISHISATGSASIIPYDDLSRLFHRHEPPVYSYTDGYVRANILDGTREPPSRHREVIAKECANMAQFDRQRMVKQKAERNRMFLAKLVTHHANFNTFHGQIWAGRNRIMKGFAKHFVDKKKADERRKKQEQVERLRLLRSNDEDAYMQLLKNTKNERLLQLIKQTDSYMLAIGAQVEKSRGPVEKTASVASEEDEISESEESSDREKDDKGTGADTVDTNRNRRSAYYTVTHRVTEEVHQPSIMVNGSLKSYQVDGLKWMVSLYNNNLNGILADEMGLGKTIQTISLITYLMEVKMNPGPYLVIVPLSTLGNWVREFEKWAPSVVKIIYRGDAMTRRQMEVNEIAMGGFNVLLTTYEFVVRDQHVLSRIAWKYIIIDEGHRMKNAKSKMAMTLSLCYRSRNRLLLTGTPLQNNLTELWALLNFLLPTIFSSADTFEQWFKKPFEQTTMGDTAELEEEETYLIINRLHQVLRPFLLRRLKKDVEKQLPQKVETVIRCDMSAWQRVIYRQMQNKISVATGEEGGNGRRFNNLIMQLKKICNHPFIFYESDEIAKLPDEMLIRSSGKFSLLAHMLAKFKHGGHRTLVFSQMTTALDYMEDFLCAIGLQYLRLDGSTKADERQDMLNAFNAPDSPYFCFLLSTRAGGLGLNLQTADTVIIFDSDWNPMMDLQAQDRAHRIGQKHEVRVIRLISAGTIEVKILDQANRKLHIDAQVIQAGQFNNKATDNDRDTMLKTLLKQQDDGSDQLGDLCPDKEEVNRMIARSDEEFEIYQEIDLQRASREDAVNEEMVENEEELPSWVLKPEMDFKTAEEMAQEELESYGRGRRKRSDVVDANNLTEREWVEVMEGGMRMEDALERSKSRIARRRSRAVGKSDSGSDSDSSSNFKNGADSNVSSDEDSDVPLGKTPSTRRKSARKTGLKRKRSIGGGGDGEETAGKKIKRRRGNGTTPAFKASAAKAAAASSSATKPKSRAKRRRGLPADDVPDGLQSAEVADDDDLPLLQSARKSRRRSLAFSDVSKKAGTPALTPAPTPTPTPKRGRGRPRKVVAAPVPRKVIAALVHRKALAAPAPRKIVAAPVSVSGDDEIDDSALEAEKLAAETEKVASDEEGIVGADEANVAGTLDSDAEADLETGDSNLKMKKGSGGEAGDGQVGNGGKVDSDGESGSGVEAGHEAGDDGKAVSGDKAESDDQDADEGSVGNSTFVCVGKAPKSNETRMRKERGDGLAGDNNVADGSSGTEGSRGTDGSVEPLSNGVAMGDHIGEGNRLSKRDIVTIPVGASNGQAACEVDILANGIVGKEAAAEANGSSELVEGGARADVRADEGPMAAPLKGAKGSSGDGDVVAAKLVAAERDTNSIANGKAGGNTSSSRDSSKNANGTLNVKGGEGNGVRTSRRLRVRDSSGSK